MVTPYLFIKTQAIPPKYTPNPSTSPHCAVPFLGPQPTTTSRPASTGVSGLVSLLSFLSFPQQSFLPRGASSHRSDSATPLLKTLQWLPNCAEKTQPSGSVPCPHPRPLPASTPTPHAPGRLILSLFLKLVASVFAIPTVWNILSPNLKELSTPHSGLG